MSAIRQRKSRAEPEKNGEGSGVRNSSTFHGLRDALLGVQKDVQRKGLEDKLFLECVSVATQEEPRSKRVLRFLCWPLKVLWVGLLILVAFALLLSVCRPVSFYFQKAFHSQIYDVVRPVRYGLIAALPYLQVVGLDVLQDCIVENPLLNETQQCPCLRIKQATELDLRNSLVIPDFVLADQHGVYVLRNGMKLKEMHSIWEQIQNFHMTHGNNPSACAEIGQEDQKGPVFYRQLFDKEQMYDYLLSNESWSFLWEECPDPATGLSFHLLLPHPSYLPLGVHMTNKSVFSIATQWGSGFHYQSPSHSDLTLVMVLEGEVRFIMNPMGESCFGYCSGFHHHPILTEGDLLIFNRRFWTYQSHTWSELSIVLTTSLVRSPS